MKILSLFLIFFFIGCNSEDEDLTCWADTTADIVYAYELDEGYDVYNILVDRFGNDPFYLEVSLEWWLDFVGSDIEVGVKSNPSLEMISDLFDEGLVAVGFIYPLNNKDNHAETAYKYEDVLGYALLSVVYLETK